jgi:hypothetical protein
MAAAAGTIVAATSLSGTASAVPQWNASALTGVCGQGVEGQLWQDTCWYNGLRADVIFGRERNADLGAGPYLGATTAGFDDVRLSGGVTAHLPVHPYFPALVSLGGYGRHFETWQPGVEGWLFLGSRSFNFHSSYVMAGGLLLGYQHGLGDTRDTAIVIAAQIDGLLLALPFLFAYEAIRGPRGDD